MATFDAEGRRMWILIAIEGPDGTGKTTNLQQLCHFFTTRWQTTPFCGRMEGDWLQLDGGVVDGVPVRCRVLDLRALDASCRREMLLEVDSVVMVCASVPEGVAEAARYLEALCGEVSPTVPVVVQANKQDAPDALDVDTIAARLARIRHDVLVLGARAITGEGVREPFATAIQWAVERTPRRTFPAWAR